jgi:stalled ribosome alternative rescue factor ArfA
VEKLMKQHQKKTIKENEVNELYSDSLIRHLDRDPTQKVQEDSEIDAAYENTNPLNERSEVDHPLAKELASQAVYNHEQFHQGNHDAHHGGWAMHDLHTWAKNYAKKKDKGIYDKEKAVKGLTHAIKNSEPSYFGKAHHEKSGQTVSGATRTQAARHLLPHVEKLMKQHQKKTIKENEVNELYSDSLIRHLDRDPRSSETPKPKTNTTLAILKKLHAANYPKFEVSPDIQKEEEFNEARKPHKNPGMQARLADHGFEYKGTNSGFQHYKNSEGHRIKHKYPTPNGNHSFTHEDPSGKTVWKSPSASDTEIHKHLEKHFPTSGYSVSKTGYPPKGKLGEARDPFGFGKKHLAQLGTIDKTIKNQVAATKKPKKVSEAEKEHHAASKPASDVASHDEVVAHDKRAAAIRVKASHGQAAFNQKWHSASDEEKKSLKKHAFQHDLDIPWHAAAAHVSKSPIHSFAEHVKQEGK